MGPQQVPVKNTFIHYHDINHEDSDGHASAPGVLCSSSFPAVVNDGLDNATQYFDIADSAECDSCGRSDGHTSIQRNTHENDVEIDNSHVKATFDQGLPFDVDQLLSTPPRSCAASAMLTPDKAQRKKKKKQRNRVTTSSGSDKLQDTQQEAKCTKGDVIPAACPFHCGQQITTTERCPSMRYENLGGGYLGGISCKPCRVFEIGENNRCGEVKVEMMLLNRAHQGWLNANFLTSLDSVT